MSLSSLSNRWLNRIYKIIAIVLVTFAVLISAMRLFLPYAQHYRIDLQQHINQQHQTDIKIGHLTTDWLKIGPVLVAEHVDLINTNSVKASLGRLSIEIDFWQSLRQQKLITNNIFLDDAFIYVDKEQLLHSSSGGLDTEQSVLINNITDLFLTQIGRFSVVNSHFTLNENGVDKKFVIGHLNWLNKGNRHQASGDVIFEGLTDDKLKLLVDLRGSAPDKLAGQIYLQAKNINITPWLDNILKVEQDNIQSNINFDTWADITKGRISNAKVMFAPSSLKWLANEQEHSLMLNEGSLFVTKDVSQVFELQTSPLLFSVNQKMLRPIEVDGHFQLGQQASFYISQLDLAGIAELVPLFTDDSRNVTLLDTIAPSGDIEDIYWHANDETQQVSLKFNDIKLSYSDGIPGIDKLSGELVIKDSQLAGSIQSQDSALDFAEHFQQAIAFKNLSANFNASWEESGFKFNIPTIDFNSNTLDLSAELGMEFLTDAEPSMSLLAQIHRADVVKLNLLYPHILMGEDLVDYLNEALISGGIEQGQVLLNGPLSAFPYLNNEGIFVVDAELAKSEFIFDDTWPAITNFAANLNFTNNGMLITAREGSLSGLDVKGVTAKIDDLDEEQLLIVKAGIDRQQPEHITALMQASPLKDSVGETLNELSITKPVSGSFDLNLPLNDTDSAVSSGRIQFVNNELALKSPQMNFSKVNGELSFINDVLDAKQVKLEWLGMPLSIDVHTEDQENHYQTNILMSADWQQEHWQGLIPDYLKKYLMGQLSWQGELALYSHHESGFSYDFNVNSDLQEAVFKLPEPYQKEQQEKVLLVAKVNGQQNQSTLNIELGEQLSFYGVLNHDLVQFSKAHLVLGSEQMLLPTDGFHITTKLEQADFSTWQTLVSDIIDNIPAETNEDVVFIESPERIRGSIGELDIFGEKINNVSFNLLDQTNWWLLHVNSKEIRSQIKFYPDWEQQGIDVDADFIALSSEPEKEQIESTVIKENAEKPADITIQELSEFIAAQDDSSIQEIRGIFDNIPTIKFQCDSCKVDKFDFGEVRFNIDRVDNDLVSLNNFKAKRGKSTLSLDGTWQFEQGGISETSATGKFSVDDVEQEVDRLGYASILRDSGAKGDFELSWPGGPHQFNFPKLNGDIAFELDDGYLAEVSDSGARILAILSLQSLLRKLTLDFRDIFSDGMFYRDIKGDMHIKDGILYTDNTRMNGSAGDLSIKGNTNIITGDLDYRMSYKPNLTSSLPVLAWIATLNPVVFLTGIAIDEVITSKVVSEFNFELTGKVDEPLLKEVNRKTKDVSVGRSSPPQFVENAVDTNQSQDPSIDDKPESNLLDDKQNNSDG